MDGLTLAAIGTAVILALIAYCALQEPSWPFFVGGSIGAMAGATVAGGWQFLLLIAKWDAGYQA